MVPVLLRLPIAVHGWVLRVFAALLGAPGTWWETQTLGPTPDLPGWNMPLDRIPWAIRAHVSVEAPLGWPVGPPAGSRSQLPGRLRT